jgi:hypothetical protein
VVTIARLTTRARNPEYPPERAIPGIIIRLTTRDWNEMTRAANARTNHANHLKRWLIKVREANPGVGDVQAEQLAAMLRSEHYVRMSKLSAHARKLTRKAPAELRLGEG